MPKAGYQLGKSFLAQLKALYYPTSTCPIHLLSFILVLLHSNWKTCSCSKK